MHKQPLIQRKWVKGSAFIAAAALSMSLAAPAAQASPLTSVQSARVDTQKNYVVDVSFNNNIKGKITFLDDGIFRYNVDPSGEFSAYAKPKDKSHVAKIQAQPDDSSKYSHPQATVKDAGGAFEIKAGSTTISLDKATAKMTVKSGDKVVMQESAPLDLSQGKTVQKLVKHEGEDFFGGGTQNGRFIHTGNSVHIANESNWVDGGVASPNPFYWSDAGYGVLRNTFADGSYDFGKTAGDVTEAEHAENELDAYYFVTDASTGKSTAPVAQKLLQEYFKVTGNPILMPEYSFYVGHLNAWNRDMWSATPEPGYSKWQIKGSAPATQADAGVTEYEKGGTGTSMEAGKTVETLNGHGPTVSTGKIPEGVKYDREFSAQDRLDQYVENDMPLGYFLPNDGYGAGYGQNGFGMTGGVNKDGSSSPERLAAVAANVDNLKEFHDYAAKNGVATGLWTQSYLKPDSNPNTQWQLLRDFEAEVKKGGVTTLKTDVAWVGPGYSMALDGTKTAYDIVTTGVNKRPNIITLDGWAGTQRFGAIWTGDQTGGNWEYIRFHVPTYIGQSLAGNPNIGSDNDGIFGGAPIITTRDYQWKSFAPLMLDMDGWGAYAKSPMTHGDPYTGISRMYLKLKSQLMPYIYTTAASAANIDTGNGDAGLPTVRAILLSDPSAYAQSTKTQYEYTLGEDFLVAPVYQNTAMQENGDDVRNGIYLPGTEKDVWIDYFTGKQYKGGQVLNNFDAPLWKLPLFVRANAIVPMWEPNNSPDKVDRTVRNVEFFPTKGENSYTLFEDTGTYIENKVDESDKAYGKQDNINYGSHVSAKFTSDVKGDAATFVAEKSTGDYTGYKKDRTTTFIVNASKKPSSIVAKNGSSTLKNVEVASQAEFDAATPKAGEAVVFYNERPNLNYGATADSEEVRNEEFSKKEIITTPKLYVKFAKTDVKANEQKLELKGFANEGNLPSDKVVEGLAAPKLTAPKDGLTPTSIKLAWNKVDGATGYDIKIDGMVNAMPSGDNVEFTVDDLEYHSTHKFQIRTRTAEGVSKWSDEMSATTLDDPWLEVPTPKSVTWSGEVWGDHGPEKAFDHILQQGDGGFHSNHASLNKALTVDYGKVYDFTKLEYHPRDDAGNGTATKIRIETSLDGAHWTKPQEYNWAPDATTKVVELNRKARFIRMTPIASVGNFFSASEIAVYKTPKSEGALPGSIKGDPQVAADDYSHLTGNCKGRENHGNGVSDWNSHIAASGADFNMNNAYDVYDMSWTMSALDGGTKKDGKVAGSITVVPEKTSVKKGDTLKVAVKVNGAKNVNAMGALVHYPSADFEFVGGSLKVVGKVGEMENLSGNYTFGDDKDSVNIALANKGDKALYNGTEDVVTFELRAKKDCEVKLENQAWLVGPKQDFVETDGTEAGPVVKELGQDAFNITMTNDHLTTDDGTNVKKLIQQNNYNGLFNNDENANDFEFKWDIDQNKTDGKLPAYVTLPTTIHFQLKQPRELKDVEILNRKGSNGTVTSMRAVITYEDGSKTEFTGGEFGKRQDVYTLKAAAGKKVKSVDITPLTSDGVATGYQGDAAKNHMLTLREINFNYVEGDQTPEKPQFQELGKDAFNITLTNKGYPTDDGTNVKKLVQQNSYDALFNGQNDRGFEFKWFLGADTFDKKVGLPANLTFELKQPRPLANVELLNGAKTSNGSINSLEAVITFEDGTKQEFKGGEFSTNKPVYTFTVSDANKAKNVTKVEIKPLTSTGVAEGIENPENRMLTIGEINFNYAEGTTPAPQQVNKDALKAKVDEVSGTKADGYTAESFKTFDKALKAAQAVLKDQKATQKQVDDALKTLTDAFNDLEKEPVLNFPDVTDRTEHRDDIYWLARTGVTAGFPDGTFRPYASVTRCDMAAFLYRLVGEPDFEPTAEQKARFKDVDAGTDHAKEIWWLAAQEISTGFGDGTFRPMDTVKRQDMAAFLHRLSQKYPAEKGARAAGFGFADVTADTPHAEDIAWLAATGVSEGWQLPGGGREFRGMSDVARGDMAAFLHRMDDKGLVHVE